MVQPVKPKDLDLKIKFGGGLHTRASADEIDQREAAAGQNFLLDLDNRELRNRPPFDLIGTVPNAAEIRGGASLLKSDGTVSTLIQAGGVVYEWDGSTGFTQKGTCTSTAKLRGHWRSHNWTLSDKVLITDLSLVDTVKEWDGTTFQSVTFTNETDAGFGSFYAKYVHVADERAMFANVVSNATPTPHLMVGSTISDYTQISVANRPSSSLATSDPFYLLTPDLKPVNGLQSAFGTTIVSSEKGRLFNLDGSSAKDFSFGTFFPGSYASGAESLAYIGTDIIYGRQGRLESVRDTASFGNSESDDLTKQIADFVAPYSGWTIAYNGRAQMVYAFPESQSEVLVYNPAMRTSRSLAAGPTGQFIEAKDDATEKIKLSPWMRWQTDHALAFQPTFVMSMLDPTDGLEYVFMGDSSGNFYRMEGTGDSGDGGSADISTSWTSKVFSAPLDAEVYRIKGYLKYRKNAAATVTLTFLFAGRTAYDQTITLTLPEPTGQSYFGGAAYFGGPYYFGVPFSNRLIRQYFDIPGQASDFQVKIDVTGTTNFNLNELGLRFVIASQ